MKNKKISPLLIAKICKNKAYPLMNFISAIMDIAAVS
jgi:hypothetical protein